MLNFWTSASQPWRTLKKSLRKPVTGLLMALSLAALSGPLPAYSADTEDQRAATTPSLLAQAENHQPLEDGVYLYGQSPERDQIGSEYLVFEVTQGEVVGAFYMPRSSFDCFYGSFEADQLALTVIDSYERTEHPYAVALESTGTVADASGEVVTPVGLQGYHPIADLNANDQRILDICKADRLSQ